MRATCARFSVRGPFSCSLVLTQFVIVLVQVVVPYGKQAGDYITLGERRRMKILVPRGAKPGDVVEASSSYGEAVRVTVPTGAVPGDVLVMDEPEPKLNEPLPPEPNQEEEEGDFTEFEDLEEPPPMPLHKGPHALVTGGQGFVGTHVVLRLLEEGYMVTVLDNNCNSHVEALGRVQTLVSPEQARLLFHHELDLEDSALLNATLSAITQTKKVDVCLHLASLPASDKATLKPLEYHQANVAVTLNLLTALQKYGIKKLVFASSADVYGSPDASTLESATVGGPTVVSASCALGRSFFSCELVFLLALFGDCLLSSKFCMSFL